ncbi:hypothetical protein [Embleya sp. AB8]|uniref:hypothetical protein n=1 Tax=Embleya sp. AB8 TaxID=3156304 RepID=UPI003C795D10
MTSGLDGLDERGPRTLVEAGDRVGLTSLHVYDVQRRMMPMWRIGMSTNPRPWRRSEDAHRDSGASSLASR